jgi:UrcA family protein
MSNNTLSGRSFVTTSVGALALSVAMIAGTISAPAHAQSSEPQRVVKFEDLNVTTSTGAHTLYSRLKVASRAVCSAHAGKQLSRARQFNACYTQSLNQAIRQINDIKLTSLHERTETVAASDVASGRSGA